MRKELPKVYDPREVEPHIYQMWMDNGCFKADADPKKKPFSIVMPPPNVTGQLHMGHAMDETWQDILTRYKRMQGYAALWVPGTDHASARGGTLALGGLLPLHHGERDLLAVAIDFFDPHLHRVADAHDITRVLNEAVGQLGDVHEAVLVHTHVDEGAKVHNVAHRALELHAGLQVVDGKRRAAKDYLGRVVARVAAGLFEFVNDVDEREGAAV